VPIFRSSCQCSTSRSITSFLAISIALHHQHKSRETRRRSDRHCQLNRRGIRPYTHSGIRLKRNALSVTMNAGCSEVMADANSGGYVKQVNIAFVHKSGFQLKPSPVVLGVRRYCNAQFLVPRRQAFIQLGRDVLGDTS